MIGENSRESFLELIRPPTFYKLSYCIGTTYSLDLLCLVQLAINSKGKRDELSDLTIQEGFDILEDFQHKAVIFTQSCKIKAISKEALEAGTTKRHTFFSLLDGIVEVIPILSEYSSFHPKVWVLRFDPIEGEKKAIFKFFTMSRNLTTSLKWDISTCLIGYFNENHKKKNKVLIDFISKVMSSSSINKESKSAALILKALKDIQYVEFETPKGMKKCQFHYKWGQEKTWDFFDLTNYKKMIIVSPFLSKKQLEKLSKQKNYVLITERADLDKLEGFEEVKKNTLIMQSNEMELHAKMYMGLNSDSTDIFIGSANFTTPAFEKDNVEAMIELVGGKSVIPSFEDEFIYENRAEAIYYPWLQEYSDDLVETISKENEDDRKRNERLEKARKILSMSDFEINYISKTRECELKLKLDNNIKWPSGVDGYISLLLGKIKIKLSRLIKDKSVKFDIDISSISNFLFIILEFDGMKEEFCTVAISNFDRRTRNKSILAHSIKDLNSFWEYLGIILNMDISQKTNIITGKSTNRVDASSNKREKVGYRFLEPLLLSGVSEPKILQKVDNALNIIEEKIDPNSAAINLEEFKIFWNQFKLAFKELQKRG